jgi:hypothetical protein
MKYLLIFFFIFQSDTLKVSMQDIDATVKELEFKLIQIQTELNVYYNLKKFDAEQKKPKPDSTKVKQDKPKKEK